MARHVYQLVSDNGHLVDNALQNMRETGIPAMSVCHILATKPISSQTQNLMTSMESESIRTSKKYVIVRVYLLL